MMKDQVPVIRIDGITKIMAAAAFSYQSRVRRFIHFCQDDTAVLTLVVEARDMRALSIGAAEAAGQTWPEAEKVAVDLPAHGIEELRDAGQALLDLIDRFRRSPDQNMRSLLGLVGMEAVGLMPEAQQMAWLKEMELSAEMAARMFSAEREARMGPSEPEMGKVVS